MERRLSLLSLIAQTTPLLGLLGTVLGILKALIAYRANLPLVETSTVADALITAAITTAGGLIVAIPAHFGFNLLLVKIDRLIIDMKEACSQNIRMLESLYGKTTQPTDASKSGTETP